MNLNRCYTYKEVETLGELLISLPGICRMKGADDVPSSEIIEELTRLACDFEEEWSKLSLDEHEELGEDWLTEIDKLADWIKAHLYDVLHNLLEYSGYQARDVKYRVITNTDGTYSVLAEKLPTIEEAAKVILEDATSWISPSPTSGKIEFDMTGGRQNLPTCHAFRLGQSKDYDVTTELVPKSKEAK